MKYLSDYKELVTSKLHEHKRVVLKANAGSGKTTLINQLALEQDICVIAPYNSVIGVYHGLPVLSNTITKINGEYTINKVPYQGSVVMNFDNAVRYWHYIVGCYSTIVVDESHTLFVDRDFRDINIKLLNLLNTYIGNVFCITATPTNEVNLLNCTLLSDETVEEFKTLNKLDIEFRRVNASNPRSLMRELINTYNDYDYIFVYDNELATSEYHWAIEEYGVENVTLFHSQTLRTDPHCVEALQNEKVVTKYNFGTTCVLAGLNFNNEGDILTIHIVRRGKTLYAEIQQAASRFRKGKVTSIIINDCGKKTAKNNIDVEDARTMAGIEAVQTLEVDLTYDRGQFYDDRMTDEGYRQAIKELYDYRKEHSRIEVIISELRKSHNVESFSQVIDCGSSHISKAKRAATLKFFYALLNDTKIEHIDSFIEQSWIDSWWRKFDRCCNIIGKESVLAFIEAANGTKITADGLFDRLLQCIAFNGITQEQIDELEMSINDRADQYIYNITHEGGRKLTPKEMGVIRVAFTEKQKAIVKAAKVALKYFPNGIESLTFGVVNLIICNDELFTSGDNRKQKISDTKQQQKTLEIEHVDDSVVVKSNDASLQEQIQEIADKMQEEVKKYYDETMNELDLMLVNDSSIGWASEIRFA